MKIEEIIKSIDYCFTNSNKQFCEKCPYADAGCQMQLIKDIKRNLEIVPRLLYETHEQQTELRSLRAQYERCKK